MIKMHQRYNPDPYLNLQGTGIMPTHTHRRPLASHFLSFHPINELAPDNTGFQFNRSTETRFITKLRSESSSTAYKAFLSASEISTRKRCAVSFIYLITQLLSTTLSVARLDNPNL